MPGSTTPSSAGVSPTSARRSMSSSWRIRASLLALLLAGGVVAAVLLEVALVAGGADPLDDLLAAGALEVLELGLRACRRPPGSARSVPCSVDWVMGTPARCRGGCVTWPGVVAVVGDAVLSIGRAARDRHRRGAPGGRDDSGLARCRARASDPQVSAAGAGPAAVQPTCSTLVARRSVRIVDLGGCRSTRGEGAARRRPCGPRPGAQQAGGLDVASPRRTSTRRRPRGRRDVERRRARSVTSGSRGTTPPSRASPDDQDQRGRDARPARRRRHGRRARRSGRPGRSGASRRQAART